MAAARGRTKHVTLVTPEPCQTTWQAKWSTIDFPGWKILESATEETDDAEDKVNFNTPLAVGDSTTFIGAEILEKPSQPPSRYTEASLVSELKNRGIGRPSTFAHILETVLDRGYATKETRPGISIPLKTIRIAPGKVETTVTNKVCGNQKDKLFVSTIGATVAGYLTDNFLSVFDYDYTSRMNTLLDSVAKGEMEWKDILREAWTDLEHRVIEARAIAAAKTKETKKAVKEALERGELPPDTEKQRYLDATVRVVRTRFGPRYVIPGNHVWIGGEEEKDRFFQLQRDVKFETATLETAEDAVKKEAEAAALETAEDGPLGSYDGHAIVLKKGPYGWYLQAGGIRAPAPDGEETTRDTAIERITLKATAYERELSDTISVRQGPKGFYIMKKTGKGRPVFRKLPDGTTHETITLEECRAALDAPAAAKKGKKKKN